MQIIIKNLPNCFFHQYVGWWHEIETYPTEADRGTCISSQISPAGTQYQVVDTNVYADNTATVSRSALQVSSNGRLTKTNAEGTTGKFGHN